MYFGIFHQLAAQTYPMIMFNLRYEQLVNVIDIFLHLVAGVVAGVLEDVLVQTEVQGNFPLTKFPFPYLQLAAGLTRELEIYGSLKIHGIFLVEWG